MPFEQRDNSASLWKNEFKKSDNHPDYRGEGMVNGKMVALSAWLKKSNKGKTFMSISFSEPKPKQPKAPTPPNLNAQPSLPTSSEEDDVPF